jgi:hypothetical protein
LLPPVRLAVCCCERMLGSGTESTLPEARRVPPGASLQVIVLE